MTARGMRLARRIICCLLLLPSGIASAQDHSVPTAVLNSQPSTRPFRATTSFSTALQCMDRLLANYGKHNISVLADDFSDSTGTIKAGARSMFIDALATMSQTSNAFTVVDLDTSRPNLQVMRAKLGGRVADADYYITGNFVQSDQGIAEWGRRIGAAIQQVSFGTSKDQMISVIGLDLGLGDTRSAVLFNDVRTANEIAVIRRGKSNQAELLLPFASLGFDMHADTSEGTHQAVRTLIDLSAIELVGKFTRVPYWKCLELPETDPLIARVAQAFFNRMTGSEKVSSLQAALARSGEFTGAADGVASRALADAVVRYRTKHGLVANTSVDFDVYFSLLNAGLIVDAPPRMMAQDKAGAAAIQTFATAVDPLAGGLQLTVRPSSAELVKGDAFRLTVSVNQDAYVYCFITGPNQSNGGPPNGIRIFPNRFMREAFVRAGIPLTIPDNENDLRLRASDLGIERVMCMARKEAFSKPLPTPLVMPDLQSQDRTMSEIQYDLQSYDRRALQSTVKIVELNVAAPASQQ